MSKQKSFTKAIAKSMAALMLLALVISNPLAIRANEILSDWVDSGGVTVGDALYGWGIQPISLHNGEGSLNVGSGNTIARIPTTYGDGFFSHIAMSDDLTNWQIVAPNSYEVSWHFFNGWYFTNRIIRDDETWYVTSRYIIRSDFAGNTYMLSTPLDISGQLAVHGDLLVFGLTGNPENTVLVTTNGMEWSQALAGSLDLDPTGPTDEPSRVEGLNWPAVWVIEELTQRQQGVVRSVGFGHFFFNREINASDRNIITDVLNIYHNGQLLRSLTTNNRPLRVSSWAIESIERAYDLGLGPEFLWSFTSNINRVNFAELAVILYELDRGEIMGRVEFTDTEIVGIQKAAYIGVVTGVSDGVFSPWTSITREQAAVMLFRLAEALDISLPQATPAFADSANIASWAMDAVGAVNAAGIMLGISDAEFNPQGNFTGEQTIITLLRLFDMLDQ